MKNLGKILGHLLIGVVIIVLLLTAGGLFYFKSYLPNTIAPQSFPQIEGEIHLQGLDGPVDVYRDQMSIPHIYASTLHDLFFAQGYVHAQDRFWQMDAWRHIGSGTLSEMFGSGQVETDAFLRTLGWRETAQAEWDGMGPESRAILNAYTDGVNAYLKDHNGTALSLEYAVLKLLSPDYKVEPWTPVNSLTWGKAMAWDLRANMSEEIERAVLLKTLTPQQIDQLFPPYPSDHPVIVNKIGNGTTSDKLGETNYADQSVIPNLSLDSLEHNVSLLDLALGPAGDGIGSNSWAVSGSHTATGMPLLANDMHLSIQMPSIWYQNALHCSPQTSACPYEITGFTFAGVPGVVAGHNDHIAWGYTNVGPDVMDLFIEKVNPDNPDQYEADGKWVDFETRTETINVVGGKPVTITVRSTRHGPVISDTYGPLKDVNTDNAKDFEAFKDRAGVFLPDQYVIALAWTALKPSSPFEAIWGFNKAHNWDDFRLAARNFHVPAQNLLYADTAGNIGYQMPGDIPIRKKGDGRFPVPGWTGEYDWTGYVPFNQLPYTFNPSEGYIATANNQVPPAGYPYLITADWDYGFRADRIVDMIKNAPGKIDIPYIQSIQGDMFDANGPVFVPFLLKLDTSEFSANETAAYNLVKDWNFQARADSGSAAVFEAFWRHLLQNTFDDDLPKRYWPDGGARWNEVMRDLVKNPKDPFWDDKNTKDLVETRDEVIAKSFSDAVKELESSYGKDPAKWNWGEMHTATFRNQTLGESGIGLIEDLFNRGPFPVGGGEAIVDATGWSVIDGYEVNWLPSEREIVDLGDLPNSIATHTTGQSGHAYNKHYDDMVTLWANIQYYPMLWDQQSVEPQSEGHLKLLP
jgi:penicillin amidase